MANLTDINGIGEKTAESLIEKGIYTIDDLASLNPLHQDDAISYGVKEDWVLAAMQILQISTDSEKKEENQDSITAESKEVVSETIETEDAPLQEWQFTFDLGLFAGRSFFYREGNPAFTQGTGNVLNASLVTLEEVKDDSVDGQKFKLFYSGEWSSAVLPEDEYQAFKAAITAQISEAALQPQLRVGGTMAHANTASAINSFTPKSTPKRKGGCTTCGQR